MHIAIIADQQKNEPQQPPDFKLGVEGSVCVCEMCTSIESYNDDANYYCWRYHRQVSSNTVCASFQE